MIAILEAGGTKTDLRWGNQVESGLLTEGGINPYLLDDETIRLRLLGLKNKMPQAALARIQAIFHYGAGCSHPEPSGRVERLLKEVFSGYSHYDVFSDLLGSARALCGKKPGIACILGTGSNACYFDGESIRSGMVSFGFWLGDEGSGGYLGKLVFKDWLKGILPPDIASQCQAVFGFRKEEALEALYREPEPNRRVAALGGLLIRFRNLDYAQSRISHSISRFFEESPQVFDRAHEGIPIHFTGSVAWHLQDDIQTEIGKRNWVAGRFEESPSRALFAWHLQNPVV